ncbi:MAG: MarR family transcriptional regulator [Chloroflexota bacterium]
MTQKPTNEAHSSDWDLSTYICFALYSSNLAMNRVYEPLLKALKLTYPQYLALTLLWQKDGQLVGEMGEQLFLKSNTLTPLLKRLEKGGYVNRVRDSSDERKVRIWLTDAGRDLKGQASCIPDEINKASGLQTDELSALITNLSRLREALIQSVGSST